MRTMQEEANATRASLLAVIEKLTEEELNRAPQADVWSISQIVQHVAMVEAGVVPVIRLGVAQEATFEGVDGTLESKYEDRSHKFNAPEGYLPLSDFMTKHQLIAQLQHSHDHLAKALNKVEDVDLLEKSSPPVPHPVFGYMSTKQWIVLARRHEERHMQQMEEVLKQLQITK